MAAVVPFIPLIAGAATVAGAGIQANSARNTARSNERLANQANQLRPEQQQYYDTILGIRGDIGSGNLTPRIPDNMQINAGQNPLSMNAAQIMQSFFGSGLPQATQNYGLAQAQQVGMGNVASNPLSNMANPLAGMTQQALARLLQGGGSASGGHGGGSWEMLGGGGAGGYDPQTNANIQELIDATNDDMARAFQRNELVNIRRNALASGGLGGSRQGIAEGVASEGVGRAMLTSAGQIRAGADNNERNRLAGIAQAQIGANAAGASAGASLAAARDRNFLDAIQLSGNFMNQGFSQGLAANQTSLGALPGLLQMLPNAIMPGFGMGQTLQGVEQGNLDRSIQTFLYNNGIRAQDLQLFSSLMNAGQIPGNNPAFQRQPSQTGNQLGQLGGLMLSLGAMFPGSGGGGTNPQVLGGQGPLLTNTPWQGSFGIYGTPGLTGNPYAGMYRGGG